MFLLSFLCERENTKHQFWITQVELNARTAPHWHIRAKKQQQTRRQQ